MSVFAGGTFWVVANHLPGFAVAILWTVVFIPLFAAMLAYREKRLRPLLAHLPHSDHRFTIADKVAGLATKMSVPFLVFWLVFGVVNILGDLARIVSAVTERHPMAAPLRTLTHFVPFALLATFFAYLLVLRPVLHRQVADTTPAEPRVFSGLAGLITALAAVIAAATVGGSLWLITTG
jgi:hypothetical protein